MGAPGEDLRSNILLKTLRLYLVFLHCVFAPSDTVPQLPCLFISFQKIRKIKYILRIVVRISSILWGYLAHFSASASNFFPKIISYIFSQKSYYISENGAFKS